MLLCPFVRFFYEHFRAVDCAFDFMEVNRTKECYKRNGKRSACNCLVMDALGKLLMHLSSHAQEARVLGVLVNKIGDPARI